MKNDADTDISSVNTLDVHLDKDLNKYLAEFMSQDWNKDNSVLVPNENWYKDQSIGFNEQLNKLECQYKSTWDDYIIALHQPSQQVKLSDKLHNNHDIKVLETELKKQYEEILTVRMEILNYLKLGNESITKSIQANDEKKSELLSQQLELCDRLLTYNVKYYQLMKASQDDSTVVNGSDDIPDNDMTSDTILTSLFNQEKSKQINSLHEAINEERYHVSDKIIRNQVSTVLVCLITSIDLTAAQDQMYQNLTVSIEKQLINITKEIDMYSDNNMIFVSTDTYSKNDANAAALLQLIHLPDSNEITSDMVKTDTVDGTDNISMDFMNTGFQADIGTTEAYQNLDEISEDAIPITTQNLEFQKASHPKDSAETFASLAMGPNIQSYNQTKSKLIVNSILKELPIFQDALQFIYHRYDEIMVLLSSALDHAIANASKRRLYHQIATTEIEEWYLSCLLAIHKVIEAVKMSSTYGISNKLDKYADSYRPSDLNGKVKTKPSLELINDIAKGMSSMSINDIFGDTLGNAIALNEDLTNQTKERIEQYISKLNQENLSSHLKSRPATARLENNPTYSFTDNPSSSRGRPETTSNTDDSSNVFSPIQDLTRPEDSLSLTSVDYQQTYPPRELTTEDRENIVASIQEKVYFLSHVAILHALNHSSTVLNRENSRRRSTIMSNQEFTNKKQQRDVIVSESPLNHEGEVTTIHPSALSPMSRKPLLKAGPSSINTGKSPSVMLTHSTPFNSMDIPPIVGSPIHAKANQPVNQHASAMYYSLTTPMNVVSNNSVSPPMSGFDSVISSNFSPTGAPIHSKVGEVNPNLNTDAISKLQADEKFKSKKSKSFKGLIYI